VASSGWSWGSSGTLLDLLCREGEADGERVRLRRLQPGEALLS
jgi:hypothetical protein